MVIQFNQFINSSNPILKVTSCSPQPPNIPLAHETASAASNKQTTTNAMLNAELQFDFNFTRCVRKNTSPDLSARQPTKPRTIQNHSQQNVLPVESTCSSATILIHDFLFSQITSISYKTKNSVLGYVQRTVAALGFVVLFFFAVPVQFRPKICICECVCVVCLNRTANLKQKNIWKTTKHCLIIYNGVQTILAHFVAPPLGSNIQHLVEFESCETLF